MAKTTAIDLSGQTFGRYLVIARHGYRKRNVIWLCRCSCGTEKAVPGNKLRSGHTKSCGCLATEQAGAQNKKHGMSHTRLFRIWSGMKTRCTNSASIGWERYGGRGITVCKEWADSFHCFMEWANQSGYSDSLTIDRIDNDRGYSPDNCRWAKMSEQARNTSRGKLPDGRRIKDVAESLGLTENGVRERIRLGWTAEAASTTPRLRKKKAGQHQPSDL